MRSLKYKIWHNTGSSIDVSSFGNEFERKLLRQLKNQYQMGLSLFLAPVYFRLYQDERRSSREKIKT